MAGAWFASDSARRLAGNILTWQTPAGGWSKHVDMRLRARRAGESWYAESDEWRYIGTFDNDATVAQMRILGGVAVAVSGPGPGPELRTAGAFASAPAAAAAYASSFLRGLRYIRDAQYPNGCIPQVYPLQGGYHDAVTFNDNATVNVLRLLRDVGAGAYGFVPAAERRRARSEFRHGLNCLLRAQVIVGDARTAWGQQHDPLTLRPVPARSYELAGLSGRESAWILDFLMELPDPTPRVVTAVHAGVAWFRAHEIRDRAYEDGLLKASPGARGLWARNTEISTGRPIMANRDGIRLYDTGQLTDRRYGYGWFGTEPVQTLRTYEGWARNHPLSGDIRP
jgi:PelA/Pel-15E family pectate lyase